MTKTIILFTMDGCNHCESLKNRLDDHSIPYMNIEINQNPHIWEQVEKQTNSDYIPTVFIKSEGSDEGPIYVPGKDFMSEDEILEIIKSHIGIEY